MKKQMRLCSVLLAAVLLLIGCTMMNKQVNIADSLGVKLPEAVEDTHRDSHGSGYEGDGLQVTVLRFEEDVLKDQLGEGWHELPLSENIHLLFFGRDGTQSFLSVDKSHPLLPEEMNGYWYFMDRHDEAEDPYDDSGYLLRGTYHFTAAIFDTNTNTLYYVRCDAS